MASEGTVRPRGLDASCFVFASPSCCLLVAPHLVLLFVLSSYVPPPTYSEGAYDSSMVDPSLAERRLYPRRAGRSDLTVRPPARPALVGIKMAMPFGAHRRRWVTATGAVWMVSLGCSLFPSELTDAPSPISISSCFCFLPFVLALPQVRETLRKYHTAPSRGFRTPPPPSASDEGLEAWIANRLSDDVREMLDFGCGTGLCVACGRFWHVAHSVARADVCGTMLWTRYIAEYHAPSGFRVRDVVGYCCVHAAHTMCRVCARSASMA